MTPEEDAKKTREMNESGPKGIMTNPRYNEILSKWKHHISLVERNDHLSNKFEKLSKRNLINPEYARLKIEHHDNKNQHKFETNVKRVLMCYIAVTWFNLTTCSFKDTNNTEFTFSKDIGV